MDKPLKWALFIKVKCNYNLIMVAMAMVLHRMIDNFQGNNVAEIY